MSAGNSLAQTITFEAPTYTLGNINGQDGWSKTGPYDSAVSSSLGTTGFGAQSLRISNAVTSGSFGDMTFSKSIVNEAGETTAANNGLSGGVRQNYFTAQFNFASAVPGAQQPGLAMSMAPDRGDGARMSYLRYVDQADGIHVFFDDFQDVAPFGGAIGDVNGCSGLDDFTDIDIATLSRTAPHTIKFVMFFVDGPRNDIVMIYIDGVLKHTGTSWEDYSRYCQSSQPATVDSLLIRTAGANAPATAGNGFLFDNMLLSSTPFVVDDDGMASATDCNAATSTYSTVQSATTAASAGDTVKVCPGTYPETVSTNLGITFLGPQAGIDARTGRTNPANEAVVGIAGGAFNLQNGGTEVVDGFTLSGATSGGGDQTAILLIGGSGHQIVNNIFSANQRATYFTANDVTFRHNRVTNSFDGFFGGGNNATIEENLFNGTHPDGSINTTQGSVSNNYRILNNTSSASGNF
ncbi:MAG: hypothetical protein ABIZ95_18490, partial [Pyrinomonadaceae bacterium]